MDTRLVLLIDIDSLIWFLEGEDVVATASSLLSNPKNVQENEKCKPKNRKDKKRRKFNKKKSVKVMKALGKRNLRSFIDVFFRCSAVV